ncbi:MAG: hypothetical protein J1E34_00365 [Oscillospiraceae bacterium]|nr:hypothetical protein [Oscillospiraceae bacterium]
MKKSKIFVLIVSVLLVLSLSACTTVTIVIPYDSVAGLFGNAAPANPNEQSTGNETPVNSDQTEAPEVGSSDAENNNTAPSENTTAAPSDNTTAAPSENTTAAPENTTAAPENTTAAPENTTAAPTSSVPTTKDEIVAYYVEAYNKIATDSKSVTRTYDYTSNYNNILEINNNSTLEGLASSLMKRFMVENTEAVAGTASDLPPVGITKLSISPSQIGSATISDKGSYYEVTLTSTGSDSNYEIDAKAGSGSAGVIGPLLRSEDVAGAAGSAIKFDGLHSWYGTAKVTAKIDKASGHITELNYNTPCVLHFDQVNAFVVKVSNCNIGLLFQQVWKIAY